MSNALTMAKYTGRVRRWQSSSDAIEQHIGVVLASSISTSEETLREAYERSELRASGDIDSAISRLLDRPFVQRVSEGYKIEDGFRRGLLSISSDVETALVAEASEYFLEKERMILGDSAGTEFEWFVRGRIAFYLAAIEPKESTRDFMQAFADAPTVDGPDPKTWLADLALKQETYLGSDARIVKFFEAFRDYKLNRNVAASQGFAELLSDKSDRDLIFAVSEHLWSVLNPDDERVDVYLRDSVALSVSLGVVENEIMARNTLVFSLISRSGHFDQVDSSVLKEALELAFENFNVADENRNQYFVSWTKSALANLRWLDISKDRDVPYETKTSVADELFDEELSLAEEFQLRGDLDGALRAYNNAIGIRRDQLKFDDALDATDIASRVIFNAFPSKAAWGIFKTVRSMSRQRVTFAQKERIYDFLADFDDWNRSYSNDGELSFSGYLSL